MVIPSAAGWVRVFHPAVVVVIGAAIVAAAGFIWRRARAAQLRARQRLARLELQEAGEDLAETFRAAADATGLPRGLRWLSVQMGQPRLLAVERATGNLFGLVAVDVRFEAIEGGDMEDVAAVGNVRAATAIMAYRDGSWTTDGRTVFNLTPAQTLQRYEETLSAVDDPTAP